LPVMKRGSRTNYPGSVRLNAAEEGGFTRVKAEYDLNIGEKLYLRGKPAPGKAFNLVNEWFSELHRRHPSLRTPVRRGSARFRAALNIERKFEEEVSLGKVSVGYDIDAALKTVTVDLDLRASRFDPGAEIFVMNELGADFFDEYRDSCGCRLKREAIGTWDEVRAAEAAFLDSAHGLSLTLLNVEGARLFRGRERVPGKLAWAGLTYKLPGRAEHFRYTVRIGEGSDR